MSNFFAEQGRTRVCGEAYMEYAAAAKPAENAAQREKSHFRMDTQLGDAHTPHLPHIGKSFQHLHQAVLLQRGHPLFGGLHEELLG